VECKPGFFWKGGVTLKFFFCFFLPPALLFCAPLLKISLPLHAPMGLFDCVICNLPPQHGGGRRVRHTNEATAAANERRGLFLALWQVLSSLHSFLIMGLFCVYSGGSPTIPHREGGLGGWGVGQLLAPPTPCQRHNSPNRQTLHTQPPVYIICTYIHSASTNINYLIILNAAKMRLFWAAQLVLLLVLACQQRHTAKAYPILWAGETNDCSSHPAEGEGEHGAPVPDRWGAAASRLLCW
jgi:hypothetical protein